MRIQIPKYEEQSIKAVSDLEFVSQSSPFLERDDYRPLFANHNSNRKWLAKNKDQSEIVGHTDVGDSVWYYENEKMGSFHYYIMNKTETLVIYVVRCELVDVPKVGKTVCQTSLWRDTDYYSTVSVPSWVFYNKLMPKYGLILSDKSQSKDGRAFWVRRIAEAFRLHYYVYVVDTRKDLKIIQIKTGEEYDSEWAKRLWSTTDQEYQKVRILISKTLI